MIRQFRGPRRPRLPEDSTHDPGYVLEDGYLNGGCLTVTGQTLAEILAAVPGLAPGQEIVGPVQNPIKPTGHIQMLKGNLAAEGAVAKITGKQGLRFTRQAPVSDWKEDMLAALEAGRIAKGNVIMIRLEGPKNVRPASDGGVRDE